MVTDIIAKLRAALDEDERVAKAALAKVGIGPSQPVTLHDDGRILVGGGEWALSRETTDHMLRHDPARVLRQVAAMRKILDLHEGGHECSVYGEMFESPRTDGEIDTCRWVSDEPCSTTLLLADALGIEP